MTPVMRVPVRLCFIVTGNDCEDDYDACEESPCDVHQICTDLTPQQQGGSDAGYTCSGCPDGFDVDPDDPTRCDLILNFVAHVYGLLLNYVIKVDFGRSFT